MVSVVPCSVRRNHCSERRFARAETIARLRPLACARSAQPVVLARTFIPSANFDSARIYLVPRADDGLLTAYRLNPGRLLDALDRVGPYASDLRIRAGSRPGRPTPHRLIRLVEATDSDLFALRRGGVGRNLLDVVELEHVVSLLEQAEQDDIGKAIVQSLSDPRSYAHDILVLAATRLLRGWGNTVQLIPAGRFKSADLRIVSPEIAVELKAPRELSDDETVVSRSPQAVAAAALRRSSHQRRTTQDSVLIIAGYRLPEFVIDALGDHLAAASVRRPTLIALIVMSVGSHPVDWPKQREFRDQVALLVTARVRVNDAYTGNIHVIDRGAKGTGLRLPRRSMTTRRQVR